MANPFERGRPVRLVTCVVTSTTPLIVTLDGAAGVSAVKIAGATYSLGVANALLVPDAKPIVLPIG